MYCPPTEQVKNRDHLKWNKMESKIIALVFCYWNFADHDE